jgi:hypothetical protein
MRLFTTNDINLPSSYMLDWGAAGNAEEPFFTKLVFSLFSPRLLSVLCGFAVNLA